MKCPAGAALKIDVLVDSARWKNPRAARALVRRAVRQAAAALSTRPVELAIVLTDDAAMRRLNRYWRGIDAATNVLSFASRHRAKRHKLGRAGAPPSHHYDNQLGDLVLAYETIEREARHDGKPFDHHLAHLAVHGFLHLLGYDHENNAQARRMETAERAILRNLAVPDPYCDPPLHHGTFPSAPAKAPRQRPGRRRAEGLK